MVRGRRKSSPRKQPARMIMVSVSVVGLTATALTAGAPPAAAATYSWTWQKSNGNNLVHVEYFDAANRITVDDQEQDGHSGLVIITNDATHREYTCWDHSGAPGPGMSCAMPSDFLENVHLRATLCIGEYASNPAQWIRSPCQSSSHSFVS